MAYNAKFINIVSFARTVAALVCLVSLSMLIPIVVALREREYAVIGAFAIPLAACLIPAACVLAAARKTPFELSPAGGFSAVAACWFVVCVIGATPVYFSGAAGIVDALYESVSGFTTTGASVIRNVSALPVSVNVWRCLTHWLGGMGIVVLTAAILPLIGGHSYWLIMAETSGPEKGKITPKITQSAKVLWLIYLGFTAAQTILLRITGMTFIDALCLAFSTMGTGGFFTKSEGIAFYNSHAVEGICAAFMFLAGINFSLYFAAFTGRRGEIAKNSELRAYCAITASSTIIITLILFFAAKTFSSALTAVFHALSVITTTGFATQDFTQWHPAAQMILFFLMFTGGCAGSTAGGIKIIRWVVLAKQTAREYLRTLHPHGVFTLAINAKPVHGQFVFSSGAFVALYLAVVFAAALFTAIVDSADPLTALTSSLAVTGNIGVAFGQAGPSGSFADFSAPVKLMQCFAMLVGRLELYAVLLLFFPRGKTAR
jgi:trk system potassium uptake protein TrkH